MDVRRGGSSGDRARQQSHVQLRGDGARQQSHDSSPKAKLSTTRTCSFDENVNSFFYFVVHSSALWQNY